MSQYPFRMNLHTITFSRLVRSNVQLDSDFREPTTDKYYADNVTVRGQYVFLYEGHEQIRRSFYGDGQEVRGRVVVSRRELKKHGLLTYDSNTGIDTLSITKYDKVIQLGTEQVDYLIKAINPSGQLMTAGSVPVIYVFYLVEDTEVTAPG